MAAPFLGEIRFRVEIEIDGLYFNPVDYSASKKPWNYKEWSTAFERAKRLVISGRTKRAVIRPVRWNGDCFDYFEDHGTWYYQTEAQK